MIYRLQILSEAAVDIKEITLWYKKIAPALGKRFLNELYEGFDKIITNPKVWFNIAIHVRRFTLSHFPYMIMFKVQDDVIIVFAVIHTRRNPEKWKKRISK